MSVVNKHGQEYLCFLPNVPSMSESDMKRDDDILDQQVDISELLKPMETAPCLIKTVDWWTYEFCYGGVIMQYHLEDNKASGQIIVLGRYESEYNWRNSSETKNRLQRFHSQFYVNGTRCDLTGEPRNTEVRFHCEDGVGDYIQRVDEPESCRYIVTIATTRVCHHPYLRLQTATTPHSITCSPALTSAQHHRYLAIHHKKQKKWLEENAADALSEVGSSSSRRKSSSSLLQPIPDLVDEARGEGDEEELKMNIKIFRLPPVKKQGAAAGATETDGDSRSTTSSTSAEQTEGSENTAGGSMELGRGQAGAEVLSNMEEEELLRLLGASQSAALNSPEQQAGESYLTEEEEEDEEEEDEELVKTGEGRQGSKSTRRDHFSRMHKRLRHLGNMFANQNGVLDAGEDDEGVGTALNSLIAALEEAEKKLNSAKQDVETLEEFLEIKLGEIEGERTTDDSTTTTTTTTTTPVTDEDTTTTTTDHNTESSLKDPKKDSEKGDVSQQLRIIKAAKEEQFEKNKLEKSIKDKLQKIGLEKLGRKFEVKILTGGSLEEEDENGSPLVSQEKTAAIQNIIVQLLSANAEELEERENHRKLEKNYAFKWDDEQIAEEEEEQLVEEQ
ncbi:hypothetical protein Pmani_015578 [Petrolisthes manimaculis]|uniref:MRH domain-containing protein n=1 Tax=Petrolisthes manimaculis TaxID=1843537 RepID=A0AAE1PRP8_9EUCA|nr:hypothetical protein Pmani_015578 [Petrolisthes manimaculis]